LPAKPVGAVPVHNLEGAARETEKLLSQISEEPSQPLESHIFRSESRWTALRGIARPSVQEAEVLLADRGQIKRYQIKGKGNPEPFFRHLNEESVTGKSKPIRRLIALAGELIRRQEVHSVMYLLQGLS
jgi:hypothetical protein